MHLSVNGARFGNAFILLLQEGRSPQARALARTLHSSRAATFTSEAARNSRLQAIADHSLSVVDLLGADAASSGGEI